MQDDIYFNVCDKNKIKQTKANSNLFMTSLPVQYSTEIVKDKPKFLDVHTTHAISNTYVCV